MFTLLSLALYAREHGSNKQMASKSCALSLVRQLYHLKVIEAYSGITKKKETDKVWLAYTIVIPFYLFTKMWKLLSHWNSFCLFVLKKNLLTWWLKVKQESYKLHKLLKFCICLIILFLRFWFSNTYYIPKILNSLFYYVL